MAALATSITPKISPVNDADVMTYGAVNADYVYQGSLVGNSSGLAAPLTTSLTFLGVALEEADNSAGAASAIRLRVASQGVLRDVSIAGASTVADIGKQVYATNDNPADLTLTIGSNVCIGHICNFNADNSKFDVSFRGAQRRHVT